MIMQTTRCILLPRVVFYHIKADIQDMMQVSTGGLAFQDIRECGKYYVDKSLLIKDMLDTDDRGVFLYTRPRRFGKTTNITMLDAFFNIEYSGNNWFDGLKIMDHPEYEHYMNAFPVVFLRLSTASSESFSEFLSSMRMIIVREYERHASIMEPGFMTPSERHLYESLSDDTAAPNRVATSVAVLCDMLRRSSGRNVVILIDEYDKALTNSFGMPHQDEIARFMTDFMNATIKENRSRQMAYITGVTQVAKAGFFSGANNLWVDNIFNTRSGERFGFTDAEVRDILSYYDHISIIKLPATDVKALFRQASRRPDVFFPWMVERAAVAGIQTVADLINGAHVRMELRDAMTYEELRASDGMGLFSLMTMTGYLNAVPMGDGTYDVSIPNREVRGMVDILLSRNRMVGDDVFVRFNSALLDGDADTMVDTLQGVLVDGSYFTIRDESSYENILLTMMHGILSGYRVRSQLESGNGRVDLILEPRKEGAVPIIMELKVSDSGADMEEDAARAIGQIHSKEYHMGMRGDVILIGLAFHGKAVRGSVERIRVCTYRGVSIIYYLPPGA